MILYLFSWFVIYITLILKIIIPFLRLNNLDIWDTSSHFQAIWFVKNYLFPHFTGWNPFAFAGFPQNLFYPPVFHYLGALLSQFFTISFSLKMLVITPILLLPVVIYRYLRSLEIDILGSLIVVIYYLFCFFMFDDRMGGGFGATFNNGLVVNNFALLLFFLFLLALQKRYSVRSVLFFSLIIITHLPTAFASAILFTIFWLIDRQHSKRYFLVLVFTFLITSFWTVSFVVFRQEMAIRFIGTKDYGFFLTCFLLSFYLIYSVPKAKRRTISFSFIYIFLGIVVISFIINFVRAPKIHVYRLLAYIYWFLPICLYYLKKSFGFHYNNRYLILMLLLYLFFNLSSNFKPISPYSFQLKMQQNLGTKRIITNYEIPYPPLLPHYINDQIPIISRNIPISGLFVESSLNSFYILRLLYQLSTHNFVWGIMARDFIDTLYLPIDQQGVFNLFHINYLLNYRKSNNKLLSSEKVVSAVPDMTSIEKNQENYLVLTEVSHNQLIEPLASITPVSLFGEEWNRVVEQWFFHKSLPNILVQTKDKLPLNVLLPKNKEIITLKYLSRNQDHLKFQINSPYKIPVLIKISYFPKWRAFADNKPINIYRAAPNLMLIFSKGDIELKYEDRLFEIIFRYISLVSLSFLIIYGLKKKSISS